METVRLSARERKGRKIERCSSAFQMPLHYPRYTKEDYEAMPEWELDCLLQDYGLPVFGDLEKKRKFAMSAFLWPPGQASLCQAVIGQLFRSGRHIPAQSQKIQTSRADSDLNLLLARRSPPPPISAAGHVSAGLPSTTATRIVLLIDLRTLAGGEADPTPFAAAVLAAARPILAAPFLSSALFTFRFFFSDLTPLQSSSKTHALLQRSPIHPFSLGPQTLADLSKSLDLVARRVDESAGAPGAGFVASSLCQMLLDYLWDPPALDLKGTDHPPVTVRSNLVIFFSNFARSMLQLSEFMSSEFDDEKSFCDSFSRVFNVAKMGFLGRDVHLSWVDVGLDRETSIERFDRAFAYLEKGIKNLGWGVCSADAISLGSAVVPFGLIYPTIATYVACKVESCAAELILEIVDVKGEPLECKCCDLEILSYSRPGSGERGLGEGVKKVYVKEIYRNDLNNLKDVCTGELFLIRGFSSDSKSSREENCVVVVDKILEMLRIEESEFKPGHPSWPIFINFLFREGFSARVSVSSGDVILMTGILLPFTVHSALLFVLNDESTGEAIQTKQVFSSSSVQDILRFLNFCQIKALDYKTDKRKRKKKKNDKLSNITWASFCDGIRGCSSMPKQDDVRYDLDLEEVYISCNLKKLRFLECWMKQSKKSQVLKENLLKTQVSEVLEEAATDSSIEASISASSLSKDRNVAEPTDVIKPSFSFVGSSEDFHRSLDEKIQQGLEFEKSDLGLLAECIVKSSISWLYAKVEREMLESSNVGKFIGEQSIIAAELVKILLRKPRDLTAKYKGSTSTTNKVREHEMQILFRMEILQSKLGPYLGDGTKETIVKDICSLLANIEFNLDGGVFGGESLGEFAGRIVRKRYSQSCGDVIRKIYEKMEFICSSEVEEDEPSVSWHNSTDEGKGSSGVHKRFQEEKSSDKDENTHKGEAGTEKLAQHRVIEARQKREMARKLAAVSSWAPNLDRVWAPKQKKPSIASKAMMKADRKECRRRRIRSSCGDVVCETPMPRSKRVVQSGDSYMGQAGHKEDNNSLACKSLFQDSD